MSLLEVVNLSKSYQEDKAILDNVNFKVDFGETVALLGESGSGKSTLLQICGLLDNSTGGNLFIDGRACFGLSDQEKTTIRRQKIGFVYQFHHLLSEFNLLDNLVIPQLIAGATTQSAREKAHSLLAKVGLSDKNYAFPSELSGGQKQRVAIVRSIVNNPLIILADEPTGNLDEKNATKAFDLLGQLVLEGKAALIVATHSSKIAALCSRKIEIRDGQIV